MVSIPSRSMDQNYMEGLVTCYIRNECKRSAVRGGNSRRHSDEESGYFQRFEAISGDFKQFQADFYARRHGWASHPCIERALNTHI